MKRLPRPFAWVMVIGSAVVLVNCIVLVVVDPSEAGPWLTGLSMVMCLCLCVFGSALVRSKDK